MQLASMLRRTPSSFVRPPTVRVLYNDDTTLHHLLVELSIALGRRAL
jgi:hypothetical protein